jgi:hypothetical protein
MRALASARNCDSRLRAQRTSRAPLCASKDTFDSAFCGTTNQTTPESADIRKHTTGGYAKERGETC